MNSRVIRHLPVALGCLLALSGAAVVAAQSTVAPIPVESPQAPLPAVCFILGDVQFPGAYEFQHAPLELHVLVHRAGGLKGTAEKCQVKIVRKGRLVHQMHFQTATPTLKTRLQAGDIIIAAAEAAGEQAASEVPASQNSISYVALAGLKDQPQLLPLFDTNLTVAALIGKLNQSPEVIRQVTIISTGGSQRSRSSATSSVKLADGMVIAFDPEAIDRDALPQFREVAVMPETVPTQIQLASREVRTDQHAAISHAEETAAAFHAADRNLSDPAGSTSDSTRHTPADSSARQTSPTGSGASSALGEEFDTNQHLSSPAAAIDARSVLGVAMILFGMIWLTVVYRAEIAARIPSRAHDFAAMVLSAVSPAWIKHAQTSTSPQAASGPSAAPPTSNSPATAGNPRILMQLHEIRR